MKIRPGCRPLAALLAAIGGTLLPAFALACPPSHWDNVPSSDSPEVVLAEGSEPLAVRIAGPFDMPWSVAFLPDGSALVTERPGHLQHVRFGEAHEVSGVPPVLYVGHGGLLDIAVDGAFAENGLIYISYLQGDENASVMRVLKARFDEDSEALVEQQDIFESTPGPRPELIGGRIALSGDGYLFLSLGDRWDPPRAQDLSDDAGSVIRIRTDGSIPDDNPFRFTLGARPEIWSYGHRNPQGLAYDPARGELWSHEHGPQGGDEVNLVLPGHNYGWPISTFGVDYSGRPIAYGIEPEGLEPPIHYWVPISVAPSGLALETDGPNLVLWIGTLAGQMLIELTTSEHCVLDEQHFLKGAVGRIRDVRIDPNGDLFVLTDGSEGMLYRIDRTPLEMGANSKAHL